MNRRRIYVAGPLGNPTDHGWPQVQANVDRAGAAAMELVKAGWSPVVPHFNVFWPGAFTELTHAEWIEVDCSLIECCVALVRLPGESPDSNREVVYAKSIGKPVWTLEQAIAHGKVMAPPPWTAKPSPVKSEQSQQEARPSMNPSQYPEFVEVILPDMRIEVKDDTQAAFVHLAHAEMMCYIGLAEAGIHQFIRKNTDYGSSFQEPVPGVATASMCNWVRACDKIKRLRQLLGGAEQQVKDESVEDNLLDLAVYCKLIVLCRRWEREGKVFHSWWPEEQAESAADVNGKAVVAPVGTEIASGGKYTRITLHGMPLNPSTPEPQQPEASDLWSQQRIAREFRQMEQRLQSAESMGAGYQAGVSERMGSLSTRVQQLHNAIAGLTDQIKQIDNNLGRSKMEIGDRLAAIEKAAQEREKVDLELLQETREHMGLPVIQLDRLRQQVEFEQS